MIFVLLCYLLACIDNCCICAIKTVWQLKLCICVGRAFWVKVDITGYGPCSVNIVKPLYNSDYYCAKMTIHDLEKHDFEIYCR